ncbi:MAG: NUDIX domain-containing protein [Candidatus Vogelbacteria bacterium]|nr:NUDIX domain-containing protein [Candidatus Vogelbacteria bacterium]
MRKIVDAALCCDGKMLLCLKEVSHSPGELFWIPPGGKAEPGESDFLAIQRELKEELGITPRLFATRGIILRRYSKHQGDWFGDQIEVQHFVAELDEPVPFQLLADQQRTIWAPVPPAGGLVLSITEALMISLRLGGYLHS